MEIVNKVRRYLCPDGRSRKREKAFRMSRFRPVRTTNIEVFTRMLEPVPQEPADLVDATIQTRCRRVTSACRGSCC